MQKVLCLYSALLLNFTEARGKKRLKNAFTELGKGTKRAFDN